MSFTRKVGNKIQRQGGMVCEIVSFTDDQVAVKATDGKLYIISQAAWMYSDVPSFFKIGKTYAFSRFTKGTTYKVIDIYRVKNSGAITGHRDVAVALVTYVGGAEDVQSLSLRDFKDMVQV